MNRTCDGFLTHAAARLARETPAVIWRGDGLTRRIPVSLRLIGASARRRGQRGRWVASLRNGNLKAGEEPSPKAQEDRRSACVST